LPVIIKTDSTCQIPEYRINKKPITTAIYHPDTKSNKFRIYPNPTPGQFNIISPEHISNIRIFDLTGRLIKQSYDTEIDISNQSSGLYIVEIRTKNQIHVEKIIKL